MKLEKVSWIFDTMKDSEFLLCYNGFLSQEIVKSLLSVAETKLQAGEQDIVVKKKVFNVMMECLQSVCKGELDNFENSFFMLGKNNQSYDIYSCIFVSQSYFEIVKSFMTDVNEWDTEKMKAEHKNYLVNKENTPIKKLLFPFIDISLKSKNKLVYEFEKMDDSYFFSVKTSIQRK